MTTSTHRTSVRVKACDYMNRNQCLSDLYVCVDRLRIPVGCTTELNHLGHQFLQKLFDKYDEVSAHTDPLTNFACLEFHWADDCVSPPAG